VSTDKVSYPNLNLDWRQKLYLRKGVVIRNEPLYYGVKFAYDSHNDTAYFLDDQQYDVLRSINLHPSCPFDLFDGISHISSLNSSSVLSMLESLAKVNLITTEASKNGSHCEERLARMPASEGCYCSMTPQMFFPAMVDICITRRCQLQCVHCNVDANRGLKAEMPLLFWVNVFTQLEAHNTLKVSISGGEPLLYPEFQELVGHLGMVNFHKTLLTNGFALTKDIARQLADARFHVILSMDGGTASTHDKFRRRDGAFSGVLEALEALGNYSVDVRITIVLHKLVIEEIPTIFNLCTNYGVSVLSFRLLDEIGRGRDAIEWMIDAADYCRAKSLIENEKSKLGESIIVSLDLPDRFLLDKPEGLWCKAGTYGLALDCDGTVFPCNLACQLNYYPIGSASDLDLWNIWWDSRWGLFRGDVSLEDLVCCSKCALRTKCSLKSCRVRSFMLGNPHGKPYRCPLDTLPRGGKEREFLPRTDDGQPLGDVPFFRKEVRTGEI
jgi:MoaA/NifB/PqqE/SkfB family radical SAM enzyme